MEKIVNISVGITQALGLGLTIPKQWVDEYNKLVVYQNMEDIRNESCNHIFTSVSRFSNDVLHHTHDQVFECKLCKYKP
jgi:hypothetical protein